MLQKNQEQLASAIENGLNNCLPSIEGANTITPTSSAASMIVGTAWYFHAKDSTIYVIESVCVNE